MFPDTLSGLEVVECRWMAGMKKAIQQGNTVYMSPAMYSLVRHADEAELARLLAAIHVVRIPEMKLWELPPVQWPGK